MSWSDNFIIIAFYKLLKKSNFIQTFNQNFVLICIIYIFATGKFNFIIYNIILITSLLSLRIFYCVDHRITKRNFILYMREEFEFRCTVDYSCRNHSGQIFN